MGTVESLGSPSFGDGGGMAYVQQFPECRWQAEKKGDFEQMEDKNKQANKQKTQQKHKREGRGERGHLLPSFRHQGRFWVLKGTSNIGYELSR